MYRLSQLHRFSLPRALNTDFTSLELQYVSAEDLARNCPAQEKRNYSPLESSFYPQVNDCRQRYREVKVPTVRELIMLLAEIPERQVKDSENGHER